jgi:hypothetical protein
MSMTLENKEYQKRGRDRRREEGGKYVAAMLTADEAAALEKLKLKLGLTARDCVGKALLELAKRTK